MKDIREVSDEELRRPGPGSLVDERAAEELGITIDEMVQINDVWSKYAAEVAREGIRRRNELASAKRTVVN